MLFRPRLPAVSPREGTPTHKLRLPTPRHFAYRHDMRFLAALFVIPLLTSCQTAPKSADWDVPYTLKTFPPAYAEYVLEIADTNKDTQLTLMEWTTSGGNARSFAIADTNKDGVVTRAELIKFGSRTRVFETTRRYRDFNKDNRLTPREFRSPGGVSVLRIDW